MSVANQSAMASSYDHQVVSGIRLAPQFVNRLCARLETAHAMPDGVSGLLFGTAHDDLVVVQAFRTLIDTDVAAIEAGELLVDDAVLSLSNAAGSDPALAPLDVVGWFAYRPVGGLHDFDVAFHNRRFPSMAEVALIVRRADAGQLQFEFYTRSQEGLLTESDHRWGASRISPRQTVSGPVEIALLTKSNQPGANRVARERTVEPEPRPAEHPEGQEEAGGSRGTLFSVLERQRQQTEDPTDGKSKRRRVILAGRTPDLPAVVNQPKRGGIPWFSSAILFALFAGGTFALLVLHGLPSSSSGSFWSAFFPDTGLNLRIEGEGDRVMLSWNRRNSLVRSASGAVLKIDDGNAHRDVHLDAGQVENGAVLYRPNTDDVTFRLEVHGQDGASVSDTLRVLDSSRANAPLDLSSSPGGAGSPSTGPVQMPHIWEPAKTKSTVEVAEPLQPNPPPPSLATPAKPQSADKFDLGRLRTPALPNANTPAVAIPPVSATTGERPIDSALSGMARRNRQAAQQALLRDTDAAPGTPSQNSPAQNSQQTLDAQNSAPSNPTAGITGSQSSTPLGSAPPPTPQPTAAASSFMGGRYQPPKPLREVLPDIAALPPGVVAATPQIEVVVTIDRLGRVTQTRIANGRRTDTSMLLAANEAAKKWLFEPARMDGKTIDSEHTIVFQFGGH